MLYAPPPRRSTREAGRPKAPRACSLPLTLQVALAALGCDTTHFLQLEEPEECAALTIEYLEELGFA